MIEIDVTTYTDANDYALYRVPEVWLLKRNQLAIYGLEQSEYQLQATSHYFPDVDLQAMVAQCLETVRERGTGVAIRELRQRL
ncbi:MAG: Uma2 family endonuclease [Coleofasciculus sp. S288]|nr:Uma2 family endonuclease [Coleofasciculus sp. S288]